MTKVSIIVPCYNVEKYLDRCITSLVNQTLKDIEIILVDDKSPDSTPALCDSWAKEDPKIRVIHKSINEGLGMACNTGLDAVLGEYVAFCDSDDWVDSEMYETLINTALNYDAEMVFSGLRRVDENGISTPMDQAADYKIYNTENEIKRLALDMIASAPYIKKERQVQMSAKVVLYKTNFLKDNSIRFESERNIISEDLFFNLDCLRVAKCVVEVPKTFYNYFINTASLSNSFRPDRFEKTVNMYYALLERYDNPNEEFKIRTKRLLIGYTRSVLRQIANSNLDKKEKLYSITEITSNTVWKVTAENYPLNKMPILHRIHFNGIIHQWNKFLLLISSLK